MSSQGESSSKAAKRAEKQKKAIEAALRNNANAGIRISDRGSDQLTRNSQDVVPLQNNSRISTEETVNDKGKGKEKITRGPTKCKYLEFQSNIEVEFNEKGQPIGANSKKLSSYAGAMAREMVSILYDDWRKVPMETKMFIWESIKQKFKLDDGEDKEYTLQMVGKLWRAYKSRLRGKLSKCKRKDFKKLKPSGSEQVEWDIFQKRRLSKEFTEKSRKFKAMKLKQDLPYTGSRKGYARIEEELKKESTDPSSIDRADVWCRGHTKKNGEASSQAVTNCLKKVQEFRASQPSNMSPLSYGDDALAHIFGPERRGRFRGIGSGVTASKLKVRIQSNAKVSQLEQKVEKMMEQIERLGHIINNQKSYIDKLINQDQQSGGHEQMMQRNTLTPESHESVRNAQVVQENTFASQSRGATRNNQMVQDNLSLKQDQQSGGHEQMMQQNTFTPESHESVRNAQFVQENTFASQSRGATRNNQIVQDNLSLKQAKPCEIRKWNEGGKCLLCNWMNPIEIVAKGRWISNNPDTLAHFKCIGNNASKVWVDKSLKGSALLWRENYEMKTIKDSIGTPVAWPVDHIIMLNEDDDIMEEVDVDEDEGFE